MRASIAAQIATLDRTAEVEAMDWIESVSEFDADSAPDTDEAR